jgi:hypothetical protein
MFSKGMVHAMGNGMLAVHKGAVTVKYHQSQQIFRHSQTLYYVPATLLAWQSIMAIDRRNCGKAVFAIQSRGTPIGSSAKYEKYRVFRTKETRDATSAQVVQPTGK